VASATRSIGRRVLKGWMRNIGTLTELCRTCGINYGDLMEEILPFIQHTVVDDPPTQLGLLSVDQFTYLEIPVADFLETDVFQIHRAPCTRTQAFCNSGPRNDLVWIQAGGEESYRDLRGQGVARFVGLVMMRNILSKAGGVRGLALLCLVNPINMGRFHLASGHIQVGKWTSG